MIFSVSGGDETRRLVSSGPRSPLFSQWRTWITLVPSLCGGSCNSRSFLCRHLEGCPFHSTHKANQMAMIPKNSFNHGSPQKSLSSNSYDTQHSFATCSCIPCTLFLISCLFRDVLYVCIYVYICTEHTYTFYDLWFASGTRSSVQTCNPLYVCKLTASFKHPFNLLLPFSLFELSWNLPWASSLGTYAKSRCSTAHLGRAGMEPQETNHGKKPKHCPWDLNKAQLVFLYLN